MRVSWTKFIAVSGSSCVPKPSECYVTAVPCWKRGYTRTPERVWPVGRRWKEKGSQKSCYDSEKVGTFSHVLSLFTQLIMWKLFLSSMYINKNGSIFNRFETCKKYQEFLSLRTDLLCTVSKSSTGFDFQQESVKGCVTVTVHLFLHSRFVPSWNRPESAAASGIIRKS